MVEKIKDYATGKMLPLTPEEIVRQQYEHILIDELGYPKSHVGIEIPIQRGAKKKKGGTEEADIVVFNSASHDQKNAYIIIETKAPGHAPDDQVFSYATATTAAFAVWFDGLDRKRSRGIQIRWRDMAKDPSNFAHVIPSLPRFGESIEEIGKYKKDQLAPAKSLKGLFQKMHNRLYGEGPLKREDAIAQEVIKILFCKLYDELHTPGDTCEFRATVKEITTPAGQQQVAGRIRKLFKKLKSDPHYEGMFDDEDLAYDDYWITYIVAELQGLGLTHEETSTDAVGDAYEIFVGSQLKGESGQFFTPRRVVQLAVDMLKPSLVRRESIIDPACGSGGFLIWALRAARREAERQYPTKSKAWVNEKVKEWAANFISGMDLEPLLYKVTKSYMVIVGDGRSGIFREDSLTPPAKWKEANARIKLGKFDVLLTNPPFGTRIKVETKSTLEQYDLGHTLSNGEPSDAVLKGGQDPAILFMERAWQLLAPPKGDRPGGRMAIVLPRQILSGHDTAMMETRRWLLKRFKLLAVVDLPPETFQPYTGTITSILFAERTDEETDEEHEIFMAVANYVGHDRRGNPMVQRNADGTPLYDDNNEPLVLNDLPAIGAAYEKFLAGASFKSKDPSVFAVKYSEIQKQSRNRFDAWYYDPTKNDVVKQIWDLDQTKGVSVKTIGHLLKAPTDVFYPGRHKRNYCKPSPEAVPFLSGTNILQVRPFDVKWQPRAYKPMEKHLVPKGCILITRSGSVGRVIYVDDDIAGFPVADGVAVSEHVIRVIPDPEEVDPAYLYAFLASEAAGKVLLQKGIYASVVRHITPEHIREIPVPLPPMEIQKQIGDRVRKAEHMRGQANAALRALETSIESAVEHKRFDGK